MAEAHNAKQLLTRRQALKLIGIGTGVVISPFLLSGCAVDPVTGKQQLIMMSPAEEIALDKQQSPFQFSSDYGKVQDIYLNAYLDEVGRELAARSHRPEMPFSFRAVNAAYINAYAFPGGSVAATRGILVELDNEAELAALLGHEIGHVCARHTAERATQGALTNILLAGASLATSASGYGSYAGLIQDLGGIGAGALLAHYSRDNEREADALGMEYMTRTGYPPQGMVGLMEVLLKNGKHKPSAVELMFSTHPMSDERYQTAVLNAEEKYKNMLSAPDHRERYMDNTADLRIIKGAITALQNGTTAMHQKKYLEAEQEFTKALAIAPNDYAALVMMSKCKLALDKKEEAERLALKAGRIYPQEAQARGISGVASILNRKYDQAYHQFTEYNNLLPGNPETVFFRGLSLEGMQRREEAASFYYQYLQLIRQGAQAQYASQKLKSWGYLK
jgi:predicted Zn-dependent protease